MVENKSPFLVFQNFISPLLCERIIDDVDFYSPDVDKDGKPIRASRRNPEAEEILFEKIQTVVPEIEGHFNVKYRGTEPIYVDWYPEGSSGSLLCDNSSYLRKKWVRTRDRDITCVLFLTDYQDKVPFDSEFETYGGKLEFPQWGFGFNPQRGTLIAYPSDPHFINVTTEILAGDLFQAKIHITTQAPLLFDARNFPGDYRTWFREIT